MCGIAGILGFSSALEEERATLLAMSRSLRHRGPDGDGVWLEPDEQVALAHRRLAIIDLTPTGAQPMVSASGRFVLTFNGELYNYQELRRELSTRTAHPFRGSSDTEVALAAFEVLGVEAALARFTGMFAFGVWDRRARVLSLARDRLGEKPLYYGFAGRSLLFASECRALVEHRGFARTLDAEAVAEFGRLGYVPAPRSIFRDAQKLPPGCLLEVPAGERGLRELQPRAYWSFADSVDRALADPFRGNEQDAEDELDARLRTVVRRQHVADVPLGCFLSGGIDSSTLTAISQAISERPVRTFSIGFRDPAFDEAIFAKRVAARLGTAHTELVVDERDALSVVRRLPEMYDEPFADSSQIPMAMVSAMARAHVTVCLSGDGGDELFGGYVRYVLGARVWQSLEAWPGPARDAAGSLLTQLARRPALGALRRLQGALPRRFRQRHLGQKLLRLAAVVPARNLPALYQGLVALAPCAGAPRDRLGTPGALPALPTRLAPHDVAGCLMAWDSQFYLPDDILVKVDRAAMWHGLETRAPFLDHGLLEFAWRLPSDFKIRRGQGKWLLRRVLARYLPEELFDRPKQGFSVPLDAWFRGALKEWAGDLLAMAPLPEEGIDSVHARQRMWQAHLAGEANCGQRLWAACLLRAWHQRLGCGSPSRVESS